jgi:hypothetical protein
MVLVACATSASFTQTDAVRVAQAEVARHGYSIPKHWRTVVVASSANFEFQPPYPVYLVRFQSRHSERSTVFKVVVNPASHKAEDFTDMRTLEPSH